LQMKSEVNHIEPASSNGLTAEMSPAAAENEGNL